MSSKTITHFRGKFATRYINAEVDQIQPLQDRQPLGLSETDRCRTEDTSVHRGCRRVRAKHWNDLVDI